MVAQTRPRSETSRDAQLFIASEAASLAAKIWPEIDVHDLRGSLPSLRLAVLAAVRKYAPAAVSAALMHYREERSAAGIVGRPRFHTPGLPTTAHVAKSVDWAAQPLWGKSDIAVAEKRLEAVVERLVLNAGRDTIVGAVAQDREAKAWARVPEPACCYFCAMLATRGAVYKSEATAGRDSNDAVRLVRGEERAFIGDGEFKVHDHCRCHVEPVFNAYEATADVRGWEADWRNLTNLLGRSPNLAQWRQYFDGRDVDGLPGNELRPKGD